MADASPYDQREASIGRAGALRPRDAATLLLIRKARGQHQVLMGQRGRGAVFMPDKWVFPGGRVEPGDARAPAYRELDPRAARLLTLCVPASRARLPRALALACVRETLEEAGLVVGVAGEHGQAWPKEWRAYGALNCAPDLRALHFLARAITPPYRSRRFDARFFLADAEDVLLQSEPQAGDDELLHVRWFDLEDAERLDLPSITRFVLGQARGFLGAPQDWDPPLVRYVQGRTSIQRLGQIDPAGLPG